MSAPAATIREMPATEYWNREYLAHALYTVGDRAIPYADTGLKPVHQRILYTALKIGATPGTTPPKVQKLAAEVMGSYHPHGDTAIADAIALMAAPYQRFNALDGEGSFPASTGDTKTAPRYTHAGLSEIGYAMVRDLKDGPVVQMIPTFDNETVEPVSLPVRFPALLMYGVPGGSMGVGWSTCIPAHNPRAVLAATQAVLADPDLDDDLLCDLIGGPDWGSGGEVIGTDGIREYITTGRGHLTVSGTAQVGPKEIRIRSLPPGVSKARLIKDLRNGAIEGKIPGIADVGDHSDFDNKIDIQVKLKRGTDPDEMLLAIRRKTVFETTFAAALNALDGDAVPRLWNVRELLLRFLALRDSVIRRRSEYRIEKARSREHIVNGLLVVQIDIDRAVAIIRASDTVDEARTGLMGTFRIDEVQADHVLSMQLRRLTKLDVIELNTEHEKLVADIAELDRIIADPEARREVIAAELTEAEKLFASPTYDRRTILRADATPARQLSTDENADSSEKPVNQNWRLDAHGVFSDSHGELLRNGIGWGVWSNGKIKITDGKGLPSRIRDTPFAPKMDEFLTSGVLSPGQSLILVTRGGQMLRVDPSTISAQGAAGNGVAGMKLAENDTILAAFPVTDDGVVLSVSEKAWKVTAVSDVPVKGRGGAGVRFHPFVLGEDALVSVNYSATGYSKDGKVVRAQPRSKATTKGAPDGVSVADAPALG